MLLELSSDYSRFLGMDTMKARKKNMEDLDFMIKSSGDEATCRDQFQEIFKSQLEIIISADEQKRQKPLELQKDLEISLEDQAQDEMYRALILGINAYELEQWANEVVTERAKIYLRDQELQKQKEKDKGLFGFFFGGKDKEKSEKESKEQLRQIEQEIEERTASMNAWTGDTAARGNVPNMVFNLHLGRQNLTVVDDLQSYKGVTLSVNDVMVCMK